MSVHTKIEWCDATLNLWWGCTKVSDGCKNCYAERLADQRYHKGNWGPKGARLEVKSWRTTLNQISKRAKNENRRLKVFCSSMADIFEGPETCGGEGSDNWQLICRLRTELWSAIWEHHELDFLILTKRPQNIADFTAGYSNDHKVGFSDNVWIGTSVEDQKTANERIPHLLKIPASVRFLSCEPLIGRVDLTSIKEEEGVRTNAFTGETNFEGLECGNCYSETGIDWVICGGESGHNARPMEPDWVRSLRDQCAAAGVPFFFKQWGGVNKNLTGKTLDGREWAEFPEVRR